MSRRHRNAAVLDRYAAAIEVLTAKGDHCHGYRYEQPGDALAYAHLAGSRPGAHDEGPALFPHKAFAAPTDNERAVMASLGIQFDGRNFRFAGYRYDRLADAVNYARRANATDSH
jgi:hypothetical protein